MGKTTTLTRHAISPPAFESTKVHRERLVDTIHANLPRKLIAVIAPAGYGKTTLLSDFASHTELPVCWLRLTEADRDVMRMSGVLQASLSSRFRRLQKTLRVDAMANADESAVAAAFARVIGSAVAEPFVLIVDDVHLVNPSPSVMGFWAKFIEVQPENMTLIMAGREVPNLPLDDLLEKNRVAGIGPLELSLTREELVELCQRAMGREVEAAEAERLQKETGGWVMGVLLSGALPVAGLGVLVQSPRPMVYDYLAAVVLNRQTPSLRKFLLHSSVLPVMTAEACDEVLGRRDSGRVLNTALRNGLFLSSTGDRPKTYEYHPQFREFLLATLGEKDPKTLRGLRRSAGSYCARKGSIEAAVDLFLAGGAHKLARKLVLKHVRGVRRAGKIGTLEKWRTGLSSDESLVAELNLEIATALSAKGLTTQAGRMFHDVDRVSRRLGSVRLRARAQIGCAQVGYAAGEYRQAHRDSLRALETSRHLRGTTRADALRFNALTASVIRGSDPRNLDLMERAVAIVSNCDDAYTNAVFRMDLSEITDRTGQWDRTLSILRSLQKDLDNKDLKPIRSYLICNISYADLYEGYLPAAYSRALEGAKEALDSANLRLYAGNILVACLALALSGRADACMELLAKAKAYVRDAQTSYPLWILLAQEIDVLRWKGRIVEAKDLARAWRASAGSTALPGWASSRIVLVENDGDPSGLASALSADIRANRSQYLPDDLGFAHWSLARAKLAIGDNRGHLRSLAVASRIGECPVTGFVIAAEVFHDYSYGLQLLRRHPGNRSLERIVNLALQFRNARAKGAWLMTTNPGSVSLEVAAFRPVVSVSRGGVKIALRPLDRELLAFLIDRGSVPKPSVLEEFWPDKPPDLQAANLHSAVYRLRCAIGQDSIETDENGYSLSQSTSIKYDVEEFQSLIRQIKALPSADRAGRLKLSRAAIALFEGGFVSSSSTRWISRRRDELNHVFQEVAESHALDSIAEGNLGEAQRILSLLSQSFPCSDRVAELSLEAFAKQGKLGEFCNAYFEYAARVREELGLDPSLSVSRKYDELLVSLSLAGRS